MLDVGLHVGIPQDQYHAMPAVSASILSTLFDECPLAAWFSSWLNPHRTEDFSDLTDAGSIAHSILLEGHYSRVEEIDPAKHRSENGSIPKGWTNKAIRAARDAARSKGKIPALPEDIQACKQSVDGAKGFIDSLRKTEPAIWRAFQMGCGDSEVSVIATDPDTNTVLRARPDRISADREIIVDLKFTTTSANPESWVKQLVSQQGYMRAAFYRHVCQKALGVRPDYFYLVVETKAPNLCSLIGVDNDGMDLGDQKVRVALDLWTECVKHKYWPPYPNRVCYPVVPGWELTNWESQREGFAYQLNEMFGPR